MSIRRRTLGLMIASAAGALAILAPSAAFATSASHPQAAAAPSDTSVDPPDVSMTDPATGCKETWQYTATKHFPLVGDPYYTVDAHFTSNPCGLTNGLEAAFQYTVFIGGSKQTIYGNDIHKLGVTSDVGVVDAAQNSCDKFGTRWWNGSSWQYNWDSNCPS
jgi:hypothetical protein